MGLCHLYIFMSYLTFKVTKHNFPIYGIYLEKWLRDLHLRPYAQNKIIKDVHTESCKLKGELKEKPFPFFLCI